MNESAAATSRRDISGFIGIGIVMILLAVILPLTINAFAAEKADLSNAYLLSVDQGKRIQVNSVTDFPVLAFTPNESGEYLLQITTSSGLHISDVMNIYSKSSASDAVMAEGSFYGEYYYSSGDVGYQYQSLGLTAGKTYYFETFQDSRYSFSPGSLYCMITKTGDDADIPVSQVFLDQTSTVYVDSPNQFPLFYFLPQESGNYVIQVTTSSGLHVSNYVDEYSIAAGSESATYDGRLYGNYVYSYPSCGYEYENVYLQSGYLYGFATSRDSRYSFSSGTVSCLIQKTGSDSGSLIFPLALDQSQHVPVPSQDRFPILSFEPGTSGEYSLVIVTSSGLHISSNVEEYIARPGEESNVRWLTGSHFYDYNGEGYRFDHLLMEAGATYYFATSSDSWESFNPGYLDCLIIKTRDDPGLTAGDVTATYGDADLKVTATTIGNSPISYAVTSGSDVVSVDPKTGALTVHKPGTAIVTVTAAETNAYCEATAEVKITIKQAAKIPFTDVKPDAYYYDPVFWAVNHKPQITNGTSETTFDPAKTCTRGQVVTFLWRAKGCPEPKTKTNPFQDVKPGDYWYKAVLWAQENNITNGTSTTKFSPNDPCTRAHVVTFLWRTEGEPAGGTTNPFKDVPSGQYYSDAVLWAVREKITNGTDADHFSPSKPCTRGQIVTFLYRDMK